MRICLHPGSRESTSGAAQLRRRSQLTVGGQLADVNIPTGGEPERRRKKTPHRPVSTHRAAENRAAVTPDTRPRPPAFPQDECRRSERPGQLGAEAHRGDHPPAVRRRGAALT